MRFKHLGKRGETLVEVLVALAITSLVLGAAMTTANHSLATSLASQERGEAIKIGESQIEQLRATGFDLIGASTSFCFNGGTMVSGGCSINGLGIAYSTVITRPSSSDHTFTVTINWSRQDSANLQQLTLRYVVY